MHELANCHYEILLFLRNHHREYTLEMLKEKFNYDDIDYLFGIDTNYITFLRRDNKEALAELTNEGKAILDKYMEKNRLEAKQDRHWKHTRLIAWISIGISIIAVIVACLK